MGIIPALAYFQHPYFICIFLIASHPQAALQTLAHPIAPGMGRDSNTKALIFSIHQVDIMQAGIYTQMCKNNVIGCG